MYKKIIYEGEQYTDYLDTFIPVELLRIADNLVDFKLKGRIAKDVFLINTNYKLIFDNLKTREALRYPNRNVNDEQIKELLSAKNIDRIFKEEFIDKLFVNSIKNHYNHLDFNALLEELGKTSYALNDIAKLRIRISEEIIKTRQVDLSECFNISTKQIELNILYILEKLELVKRIILEYNRQKLSPEFRKNYVEFYDDNIEILKEQKRAKTRNPEIFFKETFNIEKFQNWRLGEPMPNIEFEDFIFYDQMCKEKGQRADSNFQKKIGKFIIPESTIEGLYNNYGKYWGDSLLKWKDRFINEEDYLKKPHGTKGKCTPGSNLRLLITILSFIDNKNSDNLLYEKIPDFEQYVLRRWGIKDFRGKKSNYFSLDPKSSLNHPERIIVEKMI